jgi:hypothetical protein
MSSVPAATGVGLEYVMLGFFYASFIQFPLGYLLLQRKPEPEQQLQEGPALQSVTAAAAGAAAAAAAPIKAYAGENQAGQTTQTGALLAQSVASVTAAEPSSISRQLLPMVQQPGQQILVQQAVPLPQQRQQQVQTLLRGIFTPPVIACLLAVPVASIPVLRAALFDPGGELADCPCTSCSRLDCLHTLTDLLSLVGLMTPTAACFAPIALQSQGGTPRNQATLYFGSLVDGLGVTLIRQVLLNPPPSPAHSTPPPPRAGPLP